MGGSNSPSSHQKKKTLKVGWVTTTPKNKNQKRDSTERLHHLTPLPCPPFNFPITLSPTCYTNCNTAPRKKAALKKTFVERGGGAKKTTQWGEKKGLEKRKNNGKKKGYNKKVYPEDPKSLWEVILPQRLSGYRVGASRSQKTTHSNKGNLRKTEGNKTQGGATIVCPKTPTRDRKCTRSHDPPKKTKTLRAQKKNGGNKVKRNALLWGG